VRQETPIRDGSTAHSPNVVQKRGKKKRKKKKKGGRILVEAGAVVQRPSHNIAAKANKRRRGQFDARRRKKENDAKKFRRYSKLGSPWVDMGGKKRRTGMTKRKMTKKLGGNNQGALKKRSTGSVGELLYIRAKKRGKNCYH